MLAHCADRAPEVGVLGEADSTIDVYARAVRRVTAFFDCCPDTLSQEQLEGYFDVLVKTHSWSTVKVDRNGLQFFYHHVLKRDWQWVEIVKPPQVTSLPDVLTLKEIERLINGTRELRYQTFILVCFSMGLRLGEALAAAFRGALLKALADSGLSLGVTPSRWVVQCQKVGRGDHALQYLSRYLYRGVISNANILADDGETVTFQYRDSRSGQWQTRTLAGEDFMALLLQHVLPKGFRRARDYGFLHGNARALLNLVQWVLRVQREARQQAMTSKSIRLRCPCCGGALRVMGMRMPREKPG